MRLKEYPPHHTSTASQHDYPNLSAYFEMGLSAPEVTLISVHYDVRMPFRYSHLKAKAVVVKLTSQKVF